MGKSFKTTPIEANTKAESDKVGKVHANKALRRAIKVKLHTLPIEEDSDVILPVTKEVSNVYDFPKDGKKYVGKVIPQKMRK
jgi:hypothetical protein